MAHPVDLAGKEIPSTAPSNRFAEALYQQARAVYHAESAGLVVLLLALFAVAPLAYPGFIQTHSGLLPIYNLYDFERSGGASWIATVGRAADPLRASGPLGYFVAMVVHVLGTTAAQAILASYAAAFLAGAWTMFRWVRSAFGSAPAGLLAAVIYTYLPYHLSAVYVRGDLGEAWVFALWPLLFWAAHRLAVSRRLAALIATGIAWGLLATANQGLALVTLPVLAGYLWVAASMRARWGAPLVLAGIVLPSAAAYLWAAQFSEPVRFGAQFPYLFQLLSPVWNAAGQAGVWLNGLPLQVGLAAMGLGVLAAALSVHPASERHSAARTVRYWLWVALIGLISMLAPTLPLWQGTGLAHLVTYPWQALGLVGVALAVAGGATVALDERLQGIVVRAGLICLVVLASYGDLSPRFLDFEVNFTPDAKDAHTYEMTPRVAPIAEFGDQVALLDYRIEGPLRHGATVRVNVLWQALKPLQNDYVIFVHAMDASGTIRGQRDTEPQNGERPTSQWGEGEIVADRYEFQISVDGPREGYQLAVGMYRKGTGKRLVAAGGKTEVTLPSE